MLKIIILGLIFSSLNLISQSYNVVIDGAAYHNNFYYPKKTLQIRKPQKGDFIENEFYVKSNSYTGKFDIEKNITAKLKSKGYSDLIISEIEQPFQKFFTGELLNKSSRNLENVFKIRIKNDYDIFDICEFLNNDKGFQYVIPVFNYKLSEHKPNDSELQSQWHLEYIKMFEAWDIARGNKEILIGIVDSGTDFNHNDLISQVWTNIGEIPDDGIDNDENGFIDDVNGWDFVGDISALAASGGQFKPDNNPIPALNSNDHGTHVAGIAAATTNNQTGIASTGYDVRFIPVKIGLDNLSQSRLVYRPYEGLLYAASNNANIINCSWSSSYHDPLAIDVVNELLGKNILIVAAAGNENFWTDFYQYYPATIPGVISVGSIASDGGKSGFSNFGVRTTCFAPGEFIYSTLNNNRYGFKSGTSMAAPVVSGVLANMLVNFPNYDNKQIYRQLRSTCDRLSKNSILTHGKINGLNALKFNNPAFPANKVPGIAVDKILIEGENSITNYGSTKIKILLKNYLSDASFVTLRISPQDDYFSFSQNTFTFTTIKGNQTIEIDLDFILKENCPWFDGKATFLVSIDADNYSESELQDIPISIESNNKSILVQILPESNTIYWNESKSSDKFNFVAIGYDYTVKKGIIYNFSKTNPISTPTSDTLVALSTPNPSNLFIGANGPNGSTSLLKSSNNGNSFSNISVSNKIKKIDGIFFSSNNDGFIAGQNVSGNSRLFKTTNGGVEFNEVTLGSTVNDDYFSTKPVKRYNDVFIGTSKGKIIYVKDGDPISSTTLNSKLDLQIIKTAVINPDTLFFVGVNANDQLFLYRTTNRGSTFINVTPENIDLTLLIDIFIPDSSNTLYLLTNNAKLYKSDDLANTWQPELNKQYELDGMINSTIFNDKGRVRLWTAGYDINYLDFDTKPAFIFNNMNIAGKSFVDFDTININTSAEEVIFIKNDGNYKSNVSIQDFNKGESFDLSEKFKSIISAGELASATIKFSPITEGLHSDTLVIISGSDNAKLTFTVSGYAVDPLSINNYDSKFSFTEDLNYYIITFDDILKSDIEISLIDINGKIIHNFGKFNAGTEKIHLPKLKLSQGIYLFAINGMKISKSIKLIVIE